MSQVRSGAALLVHAYTASGALLAWLALRSAWDHQPRTALLWLSVAVFVDATDGFAARAADVRRHASWIDGARLDDIVDFLTYVFVPMAILWEEGYLGGASGLGAVAAALIASGEYRLVVLDEITYLCTWGWIDTAEVAAAIAGRPATVNIVITGRDAPQELIDVADTVTEMRKVKHAYDAGINAMRGIEY